MRITFLSAAADLSGGSRVIHIYARALQQRGHEVTVVVRPFPALTLRERLRALRNGRWLRRPSWHKTHYRGADYRLLFLDRHRPIEAADLPTSDIVIATWYETGEWLLAMPDDVGVKAHFIQGYEVFTPVGAPRVDRVLASDMAKITISQWLHTLLVERFGARDVVLIPNGVDMDQFDAPARDKSPGFTVGLVYSTSAVKHSRIGIALFDRLAAQRPDAQLITFGVGPAVPDMPLPHNGEHHVAPEQGTIKDLYARCDLWLCTSEAEGFGLPLLEAMACRCPVLSTPVGGAIDIVEEGVNGYLFPFGDDEMAFDRLLAIADMSNAEWRLLSEGAHATALASSWLPKIDQFEEALRAAVERAA